MTRTALSNRLKDTLKICFPQVPRWFPDVSTELVCDLLTKWPTLEQLRRAKTATVEKFFREHRSGNEEMIAKRPGEIRGAVPSAAYEAVIVASTTMMRPWIGQPEVQRQAIREIEKEITRLAQAQEDWAIFESFPGAGAVMAPRLMAALGTNRERFESAGELKSFAGIAQVQEASGNSVLIHFRWACPKFMRQTFHEWAACSIPECEWAKALYDRLKAKGKSHHMAVRVVAFKWMRILYRCWKQRVPYREDVYLDSLVKRSLPIGKISAAVQMP